MRDMRVMNKALKIAEGDMGICGVAVLMFF